VVTYAGNVIEATLLSYHALSSSCDFHGSFAVRALAGRDKISVRTGYPITPVISEASLTPNAVNET